MTRKRVAVLVSGRGSNMMALIEAANAPDYPAEIVLVLSNNPEAGGLELARTQGIPAAVVETNNRAAMEEGLNRHLDAADIDLVAMAGFMRILSPEFVRRWDHRLINIHPSLLPAFPGLETHARAIAAGVTRHGCTVHFVTSDVDEGPVIAQAEVPIVVGDTPGSLAARVLAEEHQLYPKALAMIASRE
jgi:formyltetrahydrofolate-dependent phosphoribosylglycinamide formyltransferase